MKPDRQFERAPSAAPIEVNGVTGVAADLSQGGCCAELRTAVRPGANVYGRIGLGGQQFDYTGRVVWSALSTRHGLKRVGIRFLGVEHAYFQALAKTAS